MRKFSNYIPEEGECGYSGGGCDCSGGEASQCGCGSHGTPPTGRPGHLDLPFTPGVVIRGNSLLALLKDLKKKKKKKKHIHESAEDQEQSLEDKQKEIENDKAEVEAAIKNINSIKDSIVNVGTLPQEILDKITDVQGSERLGWLFDETKNKDIVKILEDVSNILGQYLRGE